MISQIKDFVTEQTQSLAGQARKIRKEPVQAARDAAVKSAAGIKALQDPIRTLSRSGVKLTAISQGTAQSLIELQAGMVTAALTDAAAQLERAARTVSVVDLVRDQSVVLKATRERIVGDLGRAVAIFKDAGGDVAKVATQAYGQVTGQAKVPATRTAKIAKGRKAARRPARKAAARAK